MTQDAALPVPIARARVSTVAQLALIPEEEIWLQKQKSARTRRAYRLDVQHFMHQRHVFRRRAMRQVRICALIDPGVRRFIVVG